MHIRITNRCPAAPIDGFSVAPLEVGRVYDMKPAVAKFLIAMKCAEPYRDREESDTGECPNATKRTTTSA